MLLGIILWQSCGTSDRRQERQRVYHSGRGSTIVVSQVPVDMWHQQIGDGTVAYAILDRLVHNAYRIEINGESMRKERGKVSSER